MRTSRVEISCRIGIRVFNLSLLLLLTRLTYPMKTVNSLNGRGVLQHMGLKQSKQVGITRCCERCVVFYGSVCFESSFVERIFGIASWFSRLKTGKQVDQCEWLTVILTTECDFEIANSYCEKRHNTVVNNYFIFIQGPNPNSLIFVVIINFQYISLSKLRI